MADTVHLTVVTTEGEADALCGLLRSEDIPCSHWPTNVGVMGGGLFGSKSWTEILVNEADLPHALEVLASAEQLEAECVECGRPIGDAGGWYSDGAVELVPLLRRVC